jgi:hypothetical protein
LGCGRMGPPRDTEQAFSETRTDFEGTDLATDEPERSGRERP